MIDTDFTFRLLLTILLGLAGCGCAHVGPSFREVIVNPETGVTTKTIIKAPATAFVRGNVTGDRTGVYYEATTTDPDTGIVESFILEFGADRDSVVSDVDIAAITAAILKGLTPLLVP